MNKLRLFFRRTFVENLGIKTISLLVTLLLFYFVREGKEEARTISLDIELTIPKGVVQTNEIAPKIDLSVVGPKAIVDAITAKDLGPIGIDLSPHGIGSSTLFLHKDMVPGIPHNVSVGSFRPSYIAVRLEKEVNRVLPVTPILMGQPAHGYRIDRYSMSSREATLIGPESLVERTDYLETASINIAGATKTVKRNVPIRLPAANTRLKAETQIEISVHIIEEILERVIEGIQVSAAGQCARVEPKTVSAKVKGPMRLVEKLSGKNLTAKPVNEGRSAPVAVTIGGLPTGVVVEGPPPKATVTIERNCMEGLQPKQGAGPG